MKVERYDESRGECDLYDPETGRRWRSPCEPTGRQKPNEDQKSKREESDMQTETVFENAGQALDAKVRHYCAERHCSYDEGFHAMKEVEPQLWHRYASGESDLDPKDKEGSEEFARRIQAYSEHFKISPGVAELRVRQDDPKMKKYSRQGGSIVMDTEQIPLSAESVVDSRAQERMAKGEVKDYAEAVKAILAEDPLLAECYRSGRPYLEGSAAHAYEDEQTNGPTEKARLGVLINGARKSDNSPDVELMLKTANLAPDLVRGAASERIDELANEFIDKLVAPGLKSERYPEALGQVRRDNPALVAAAESGRMSEEALRQIFWPWFSRD